MLLRLTSLVAVSAIASQPALADDFAQYTVGYVGVGVGGRAVQGFTMGFDMGWLQTSGPEIHMVEGSGENASDAIGDNMMFGSVLPNLQLSP